MSNDEENPVLTSRQETENFVKYELNMDRKPAPRGEYWSDRIEPDNFRMPSNNRIWVKTNMQFVHDTLKEICIWNGATNMKNGFLEYEFTREHGEIVSNMLAVLRFDLVHYTKVWA